MVIFRKQIPFYRLFYLGTCDFRLRAVFSVFDDNIQTAGLLGVRRRFNIYVTTDTGSVVQTPDGCHNRQIQMPSAGVYWQHGNHVRAGGRAGNHTRHDVQRRDERSGCNQVAVILVVLRHDFADQRGRHGEKRAGGHDLHGPVGYCDNNFNTFFINLT